MASAAKKITLSASRDIPFNKLVLSQANVRRIKAGVSIEELAEDIARRTLLQSITVRPVLDDDGAETGMFEIPAGGRRYRALELLVKQKRLATQRADPLRRAHRGDRGGGQPRRERPARAAVRFCLVTVLLGSQGCYGHGRYSSGASKKAHRRPGQAFPQRSEDNA